MNRKDSDDGRSREKQARVAQEPPTTDNDEASRASLKLAAGFGLALLIVILLEVFMHGVG